MGSVMNQQILWSVWGRIGMRFVSEHRFSPDLEAGTGEGRAWQSMQ